MGPRWHKVNFPTQHKNQKLSQKSDFNGAWTSGDETLRCLRKENFVPYQKDVSNEAAIRIRSIATIHRKCA